MKKEAYIGVGIIAGFALFNVPLTANAAVGVSPAAAVYTLNMSEQADYELSFMRDPVDAETTMRVTVSTSEAFLIGEGMSYMMYPGDSEIKIPYRINTEGYATGTHDGYVYIEPERIEEATAVGNSVKVRGGVRVSLTVVENTDVIPPKKWLDIFTYNLIQNFQIAAIFFQK